MGKPLLYVALFGAALVCASCSHEAGKCGDPRAIKVLAALIVQEGASDDIARRIDSILSLSSFQETGAEGGIDHCVARFDVMSRVIEAEKKLSHADFGQTEAAAMARKLGMSEKDISDGVNSGTIAYDLVDHSGQNQTDEGGDSGPSFGVTLNSFNIARAKLFKKYLNDVSLAENASVLNSPTIVSWDAKNDGSPKLYRLGDVSITLSAKPPEGDTPTPTPILRMESQTGSVVEIDGAPGFETAAAKLVIGKLDPRAASDTVLFLTYSGGAHCCTQIHAVEMIGPQWKQEDLGMIDGEGPSNVPGDIDGDGIPDLVLIDQGFLYSFASYADSYAPMRILNIIDGVVTDVSAQPRYAKNYKEDMIPSMATCMLHNNGGCAAFVASAARAGYRNWAWQFMLDNYNPTDTWELPKSCDIANALPCPDGHVVTPPDYPTALNDFLTTNGYFSASGLVAEIAPSYDCSKVHSQVLKMVCSTSALSSDDEVLAAAYYAAVSNADNADTIKKEERDWIALRNNSSSDPAVLQALYADRIAALRALAAQEIAAKH